MKGLLTLSTVMAVAFLALGASNVSAQVFGTFSWQMQPYCNVVTLTLTSVTGNFTLDGSDNQCDAPKNASASGIGVFNPDGSVGLNFTIVTSPSGTPVHVSASVSPANGQGTWFDDAGNSGTFAFFAAVPGLPARPAAVVRFRATNANNLVLAPGGNGVMTWAMLVYNVGGGVYNAGAGTYVVPATGTYLVAATRASRRRRSCRASAASPWPLPDSLNSAPAPCRPPHSSTFRISVLFGC